MWEQLSVVSDQRKRDQELIIDNPYFGPSELNFDVWFSYRRPLTQRVDWKAQLNIRNAFGDDDYIPVLANPDGGIASFRNPNPSRSSLTNTFSS